MAVHMFRIHPLAHELLKERCLSYEHFLSAAKCLFGIRIQKEHEFQIYPHRGWHELAFTFSMPHVCDLFHEQSLYWQRFWGKSFLLNIFKHSLQEDAALHHAYAFLC